MYIALANWLMLSSIVEPLTIVNRSEWSANPAKLVEPFPGPASYVIIHHSYEPAACTSEETCIQAMLSMQRFHQVDRDWNDIGYSFAVGGDGRVYQGRGFNVIGAHAPKYNDKSVGICLIGDWQKKLPPQNMLDAAKRLIEHGITEGHIAHNYVLHGHRQVRDTVCPGEALFSEISTWPHFSANASDPNHNDNDIPN